MSYMIMMRKTPHKARKHNVKLKEQITAMGNYNIYMYTSKRLQIKILLELILFSPFL